LLQGRTNVPSGWTQFAQTVQAEGKVRFAIRYHDTNVGLLGNANYIGIDAVQIYGNPVAVPISKWWIASLFALIAVGFATKKLFF
jgi:hypothetical protein